MKKIILSLLLIFLTGVNYLYAADIKFSNVKDEEVIIILNKFTILDAHDDRPFTVRLLKVDDDGECGPNLEKCPKSTLYVAVSEIALYPDRMVYKLSKLQDLKFIKWISKPNSYDDSTTMIFRISGKDNNSPHVYDVSVSLQGTV